MAIPTTLRLDAYEGDDFIYAWQVVDVDDNEIRTPRDMTGATGRGQVRATEDATSTLIATFDYDDSAVNIGIHKFQIPRADMEDVEFGTYWYDLEITHDDIKKTWFRGQFVVTRQITPGA